MRSVCDSGRRIAAAFLQSYIGVSPSGKATDSDSVIRWFESSYPSHRYHILYKEYASKYNIWFLFYMAYFTLPQFGERIGETFRSNFCPLPYSFLISPAKAGVFVCFLSFSKIGLGKFLSINYFFGFFELKFVRIMCIHRRRNCAAQTVSSPYAHDF